MDDYTFYLASAVLVLATLAIFFDASSDKFQTPDGLFTMLAAFAAFLGARAIVRKNGKGNGKNGG